MKNEILKLVRKKSFYVVTFIFILFCILTNVVYRTLISEEEFVSVSIEELEEENRTFDLNNSDDLIRYVENLTLIYQEQLKEEYSSDVQEYLINHFLYTTIYRMYESEYILDDQELAQEYSEELEQDVSRVRNNDWEFFLDERIAYLEERASQATGVEQLRYQKLLELAYYRKNENVSYDPNSYLHRSLEFLEENMVEYINLQNAEYLTDTEKDRLAFLMEEMSIHEYVIDEKEDLLNEHTLRAVLIHFPSEFGLFILIYVIMIAGSIVSEEFSRGTIKSLLTKPYQRRTILTSKLLVVLLLIPIIMIFMSLLEILIGGVILGFDSLNVPVVLYSNGVIQSFSVLGYLFLLLLGVLPMYLILGILAFMISTITLSTSAAITISFLFYLLANVVSNLALVYDWKFFKVFISLYWDFTYLVTSSPQPYGISILTSVLVLIFYAIVMLCLSYVIFVKKDVKNI